MSTLDKYKELASLNTSLEGLYIAARNDGYNPIEAVLILQAIFQLSLKQLKGIPFIAKVLEQFEDRMTGKSFEEVLWNGRSVGLALVRGDDFPHYYGKWYALDLPETQEFLEAVRSDEGAEIECGEEGNKGVISADPSTTGDVDIQMR